MSETPKDASTVNLPPLLKPKDGITEFYANWLHINWTGIDVRMRFGQATPVPPPGGGNEQWAVEERAAITMAWAEAKYLRDVLTSIIDKYETVNGPIETPTAP